MEDLGGMSFSHLPHVHIALPQIQFLLHRDCIRLEWVWGFPSVALISLGCSRTVLLDDGTPIYQQLVFCTVHDTRVILTATAVAASEAQNTEELRRTMSSLGNETKEPQHRLQPRTAV